MTVVLSSFLRDQEKMGRENWKWEDMKKILRVDAKKFTL